jgi:pimeloyl-ACP methyl ester carboxylesterase
VNANREDGDFGLADLADEAWRPAAELGLLLVEPVICGVGARRGDGRPMLVLPGLYGGDRYLSPLRDWLRRIGYSPVPSGLHRNPGWSERLLNEVAELAEARFQRSGQRVTIIGHSMGGLQGRAVAARRPRIISHVIALTPAIVMNTIASGHLEQAGAWTGTAEIDGAVFTLDGGRGNRDKSWGSREPKGERGGLEMWRWFSINIGDDAHFGGIRMGTEAGDVHKGWVWRDGWSSSIRRWDLLTVVDHDGMTPKSLDAVVTDKEGHEHKLHGEIIRVWEMVHDKTMALQECLTRFELAGVGTGYGISEYMHRLDDSGRPTRSVE